MRMKVAIETDYTKIKVHPLFEPIKKLFEFFILGIGFVGMPDFQKQFLMINPGLRPLVDAYNKETNLRIVGSQVKSNSKLYLVYIGRLMSIAIFDFLQSSRYQKDLNQTEIFRFAKHIRNGTAHNNKFNFTKEELIGKPARWQDKVINISLKGKTVIPDFINPVMLLFLMSDISELIELKKKKE